METVTPKRKGPPIRVHGGVPTSIYLPRRHVDLIEAYRRSRGLRSTSEAHREIIERWLAERERER